MYCPTCAAHNSEDTKFCRSCGASLEIIILALSGQLTQPAAAEKGATPAEESWQTKLAKGRRDLITGAILLTVPLLLLFVPMLLMGNAFPWLIIWSIFFGWMAVWGTSVVASGIGGLVESKTLMQHPGQDRDHLTAPGTGLLPATSKNRVTSPDLIDSVNAPASITEATTRNLDSSNRN